MNYGLGNIFRKKYQYTGKFPEIPKKIPGTGKFSRPEIPGNFRLQTLKNVYNLGNTKGQRKLSQDSKRMKMTLKH